MIAHDAAHKCILLPIGEAFSDDLIAYEEAKFNALLSFMEATRSIAAHANYLPAHFVLESPASVPQWGDAVFKLPWPAEQPHVARRHPASNVTAVVQPASQGDAALQRWKDWLYLVERGNLEDDSLSAELTGRSAHDRKLVLAAMAKGHGFSVRTIAKQLNLACGTAQKHLAAFRGRRGSRAVGAQAAAEEG
jgi:hypothetical protein